MANRLDKYDKVIPAYTCLLEHTMSSAHTRAVAVKIDQETLGRVKRLAQS